MKQIVTKVITYKDDYRIPKLDGRTSYIFASIHLNDEFGLLEDITAKFTMDIDKFESFDQGEAESFDSGLIWPKGSKLAKAWQALIDAQGPVAFGYEYFEETMCCVKRNENGDLSIVKKNGREMRTNVVKYPYLANSIAAGKESQRTKELANWMPLNDLVRTILGNNDAKDVLEEEAEEVKEVSV